jgi:hypothetical protein
MHEILLLQQEALRKEMRQMQGLLAPPLDTVEAARKRGERERERKREKREREKEGVCVCVFASSLLLP